jgi:hypothetical protein
VRCLAELDRLDPQLLRQRRLVLPNLTDHHLGCLTLEEELDDLLGLGADDALKEHGLEDRHLAALVLRTCVRMTSSGSAYGRFRRALDNGNVLGARAAAIELKHVGLAEALELTLLILVKEPPIFRAAALRWHARYCGDNKVSIEEATAVLGLLAMLEGRRAKVAAQALACLLDSRTLLPAAEVLVRWAHGSDGSVFQ